jgi:putative transposase
MTNQRWKASNTAVYNLNYHVIFCPKYRRPVLVDEVEVRLRELLMEKAHDLDIKLKELEIMPDHVHLFVQAPPTLAPHYMIGQLKGYSSRILRQEFAELRSRLPTLWTRSYYVESVGHSSVGHISEETVTQYIQDQKGK